MYTVFPPAIVSSLRYYILCILFSIMKLFLYFGYCVSCIQFSINATVSFLWLSRIIYAVFPNAIIVSFLWLSRIIYAVFPNAINVYFLWVSRIIHAVFPNAIMVSFLWLLRIMHAVFHKCNCFFSLIITYHGCSYP